MAIFALFHYALERVKDSSSLPFDDGSQPDETPMENVFESLFGTRGDTLNLYEEKERRTKNKETERIKIPHESEILEHGDHIVAFRVQVNKSKNLETKDWGHKKEGHYPEKLVLMDCRPDSRIIAIEKTSESDTDTIYELLRINFRRKLTSNGIDFTCIPLIKQKEFWEAVNEIRHKFHDVVKQVKFDFVGKDVKKDTRNTIFTDEMLRFIKQMEASAQISIDVCDDKKLRLVTEDLTRMAELCREDGDYSLTVGFRDFGLFRFGQDIKAQWGLEDDLIAEYTCPNKQMNMYESVETRVRKWFEHITILFKDYIPEDEEKTLCLKNYVICEDENKKTRIVKYLVEQVARANNKPKEIVCPLRAAMDAGCIDKPAREVFEHECNVSITFSSWKRYIGGTVNPYENNRVYKLYLGEFGNIMN